MNRMLPLALAGLAASLALGGCARQVAAPTATGVCWQAIPLKNGDIKSKVRELMSDSTGGR